MSLRSPRKFSPNHSRSSSNKKPKDDGKLKGYLLDQEQKAEERQRLENELRDKLEIKERKLAKKEAQLALLSQKEKAVEELTLKLEDLSKHYESLKNDTSEELDKLRHDNHNLANELSQSNTEIRSLKEKLEKDKTQYLNQIKELKQKMEDESNSKKQIKSQLEETLAKLNTVQTQSNTVVQQANQRADKVEQEFRVKQKEIEQQLDKITGLNKALTQSLQLKESQDRQNVQLLQMLNHQLDTQRIKWEEAMAREESKSSELYQQLTESKHTNAKLETQVATMEKELELLRKDHQNEIMELQEKLSQMKFDTKFLHSELNTFKTKLSKKDTLSNNNSIVAADTNTNKTYEDLLVDLQTARSQIGQLQETITKKERAHYDKVTFLNAQIANNRTAIANLHNKIHQQKEIHINKVMELNQTSDKAASHLYKIQNAANTANMMKSESEIRLASHVNTLRVLTLQLQSSLMDKELEHYNICSLKDDQIRRLQRRLEEAFVPIRSWDDMNGHQTNSERQAPSPQKEAKLQSQIDNLNRIVDLLCSDLKIAVDDKLQDLLKTEQHIQLLKRPPSA